MAVFAKRPSPHHPLDERKIRPLSGSDSISGKTLLTLLTLLVVGLVSFSYSGIVPPPLPESPSRPSEPPPAAAAAAGGGGGGGERAAAEEADASSPWDHDGDVESEHDGNSEALQLADSQHVSSSGDGGDKAALVAEDEAEAEGGGGKNAEKDVEEGQSGSSGDEGEGVEGPEGDDVVDEGGDEGEAEGDTVEAVVEGEEGEGDGASDALDEVGQDEDEGGQGPPGAEAAAKKPKVPNRCAVTPEVVAFTMNQLNNTALTMKPYPHLYVKPVFRPDFYDCIMSHVPPSAITERVYNRLPNDRYQLTIQGKYFGPGRKRNPKIPVKSRHFWNDFAVAFGGEAMVRLWLEKFDVTLRNRQFSHRDAPKAFFYSFDIGRDKRGYEIGPHTDTMDKWVTTLFYLPRSSAQSQAGTCVVRSKSGKTDISGRSRGKLGGDLQVARKVPFAPNAVFAFAACDASWHAVQSYRGSITRDTIQGFVKSQKHSGKGKCGDEYSSRRTHGVAHGMG